MHESEENLPLFRLVYMIILYLGTDIILFDVVIKYNNLLNWTFFLKRMCFFKKQNPWSVLSYLSKSLLALVIFDKIMRGVWTRVGYRNLVLILRIGYMQYTVLWRYHFYCTGCRILGSFVKLDKTTRVE